MRGENAIDALWDALETVHTRLDVSSLAVREPVELILAAAIEQYDESLAEDAARNLFDRATVNLGTIKGAEAVNSVSRFAHVELEVRLPAGVTATVLEDVLGWLRDREDVTIADVRRSVRTFEPPESPLVDATTVAAWSVINDRVSA